MAASTTLCIEYFASAAPPSTGTDVGICFSGGGSRALAATPSEAQVIVARNPGLSV
ncbi:MAG: hypothetical protein ACHQ4J_10065 [Candidatus Binatia bacterium]